MLRRVCVAAAEEELRLLPDAMPASWIGAMIWQSESTESENADEQVDHEDSEWESEEEEEEEDDETIRLLDLRRGRFRTILLLRATLAPFSVRGSRKSKSTFSDSGP